MGNKYVLIASLIIMAACQNPAQPVRDNYNDVGYYQGTQLDKPASGATIKSTSQSILFSWDQQPMQSTFGYSFQIKPADGDSWPARVSVGRKHEFTYPTDTLNAGKTYEWRVGRNWTKKDMPFIYWSKSRTFLFE